MEQKFKSLSIFEFQQKFPDDDACYQHLAQLKRPNGFSCPKCGHGHYCQGRTKHHRQYTRCKHQASPKSQTLFHYVKFPLLNDFYIVFYMSTSNKGINSKKLSRKLALRQKTCWGFQQMVRKAMESSQAYPMKGDEVEVDERVVGAEEENVRGCRNEKKKLVVVGIEKRGRGISRMYGQKIGKSSGNGLSNFFDNLVERSIGAE